TAGTYLIALSATNSAGTGTATLNFKVASAAPVPPTFVINPQNTTVKAGLSATFTVGATGTGPIAYQWLSREVGTITWTTIAGASSSTYTTPMTTMADNGRMFIC